MAGSSATARSSTPIRPSAPGPAPSSTGGCPAPVVRWRPGRPLSCQNALAPAHLDSWDGEESYRAYTADRPAPLRPEEVTQPPVQIHLSANRGSADDSREPR